MNKKGKMLGSRLLVLANGIQLRGPFALDFLPKMALEPGNEDNKNFEELRCHQGADQNQYQGNCSLL